MAKTIMVVLDGCKYDSAVQHMGYLEHLCEMGLGAKYKVKGELPAMSRPIYETLMTGLPVSKHGIYTNGVCRTSQFENIFSLCEKHGKKTAASAYFWMSELYKRAPFNRTEDRICLQSDKGINHGIYYYEDHYPDSHVFADAEWLRKTYDPDFLLIHPMNIDNAGHKNGGKSQDYFERVMVADCILANMMNSWIEEGYEILVTADHGMNEWGFHCGGSEDERMVPLYIFSKQVAKGDYTQQEMTQLAIAPLVCKLLGIEKGEEMIAEEHMQVKWAL